MGFEQNNNTIIKDRLYMKSYRMIMPSQKIGY